MAVSDSRVSHVLNAYRGRSESRNHSTGFVVYAGIMVVLVALAPAIRALLLLLVEPEMLLILGSPQSATIFAVGLGIVMAAMPLLGAARGPAFIAEPFVAHVLLKTEISRTRILARPLCVSIGVFTLITVAVFSLLATALVIGANRDVTSAVVFVVCGGCYAITASLGWLIGQRLGAALAWAASGAALLVIAATNWVPGAVAYTPWGIVAATYPSRPVDEIPALVSVIAMTALASILLVPLSRSVRDRDVVDQALRWRVAVTATIAGDPALALATFRSLPRAGRTWRALATATTPLVMVCQGDLIGALRTPVRFAGGCMGLLAAGALCGIGYSGGPAGSLLVCGAGALAFLSLGPTSDGLRHAAEAYAAPPLYGYTANRLVWLHTVLPLTIGSIGMAAGCMGTATTHFEAVGVALWLALNATLIRVFDSAKGALSPVLLSPIPTPFGDLSGLVVLFWHLDALAFIAASGLTVGIDSGGQPLVSAAAALAISGLVAWLTVRRFRRL